MRRIIFTLLILPAVLASAAQESFDVDGVTYVTTSSTTVSATGGVSTLTSLVIPETVTNGGKTYTVTDIGRGAFKDCPLTEVTLPSTLLTFGTQPFNGSNGLVITLHAVQAPMSTGGGWIATESEKCTLRVPAIAFDEYYYKWYFISGAQIIISEASNILIMNRKPYSYIQTSPSPEFPIQHPIYNY